MQGRNLCWWPGVARGYLNQPALTAERFIPDLFLGKGEGRLYRTGDLGRWRPDGLIEYLGRVDRQVKIRGMRVELEEIESKLLSYPGMHQAIVITDESGSGDLRLVAYVVGKSGTVLTASELRTYLSDLLPDYMIPTAFVVMDTFHVTPNGKLDRRALPRPNLKAMVTRPYYAPEGTTETSIADLWQDLLDVERIGRHDHFFELGGHSLLGVTMVSRLHQGIGIQVDLQTLFRYPILCDFALRVVALKGC